MMRLPAFRSKGGPPTNSGAPLAATISVTWNREGIEYRSEPAREGWLSDAGSFGADAELAMLLGQLEEEGFAELGAASVKLSWQDFIAWRPRPITDRASPY